MRVADLWDWAFRWREDRRQERTTEQSLVHNDTRLALELADASVAASERLYVLADDGNRDERRARLEADLEYKRDLSARISRGLVPELLDPVARVPIQVQASPKELQ